MMENEEEMITIPKRFYSGIVVCLVALISEKAQAENITPDFWLDQEKIDAWWKWMEDTGFELHLGIGDSGIRMIVGAECDE